MNILKALGTQATDEGYYEFLRIGEIPQELFKDSALVLIALFLFYVGSQMNMKTGSVALKKGLLLTLSKYLVGLLFFIQRLILFDTKLLMDLRTFLTFLYVGIFGPHIIRQLQQFFCRSFFEFLEYDRYL